MAGDKTDLTDKTPVATIATTATQAVNEWGIPDWRDPLAYGDVKRWTFNRWRWEFYRRRDDLRAYFDAHAARSYELCAPLNPEIPKPHEPGFGALVDLEARKRFGYSPLPNPRIGAQPPPLIMPYEHDGVGNIIDGSNRPLGDILRLVLTEETSDVLGRGLFEVGIDPLSLSFEGRPAEGFETVRDAFFARLATCQAAPLEESEIALTFDLKRPLEPQIEHARQILRQYQAERLGKPLQRRRHPDKWLGYLRTIDAREDDASWVKIAALHPNTAQTEQTARDIWKAADALRFNF